MTIAPATGGNEGSEVSPAPGPTGTVIGTVEVEELPDIVAIDAAAPPPVPDRS